MRASNFWLKYKATCHPERAIQAFPPNLHAGKIEEAKLPHKTTIACIDKEPLAFHAKGEPYVPTLRVVHKYPGLMPRVTVDKGAIRFVLNGANVKAPGLTSEGGSVEIDEPAGTPVAVYAEGKASAIAVGTLAMDAKDIKPGVMGDAIKVLHYLNDGLWKLEKLA